MFWHASCFAGMPEATAWSGHPLAAGSLVLMPTFLFTSPSLLSGFVRQGPCHIASAVRLCAAGQLSAAGAKPANSSWQTIGFCAAEAKPTELFLLHVRDSIANTWRLQVRAAVPMYILSRKIKAMGVKVVCSGEGADEMFGGYLYFHKAPNAAEFHK